MQELPEWDDGTVAVLTTGGGALHAIPVSSAVRAGPDRLLIALAPSRESLARLRREPRCALTIVAAGVAFTAHARARVVAEETPEGVTPVALEVDTIQDHRQPTFAIDAGVAWHWTDDAARERDDAVHDRLRELARR